MILLACGCLLAISIYLLLEKSFLSKTIGLLLLGNAVNLIILICGRLSNKVPVFIHSNDLKFFANPLAQALILTAIVIGFGLLAYLCSLLQDILTNQARDKS